MSADEEHVSQLARINIDSAYLIGALKVRMALQIHPFNVNPVGLRFNEERWERGQRGVKGM